jgi:hypothetical protein
MNVKEGWVGTGIFVDPVRKETIVNDTSSKGIQIDTRYCYYQPFPRYGYDVRCIAFAGYTKNNCK